MKTSEFLKTIKGERKKNLMGLTIDLEYFDQFLKSHDEDKLRKLLEKEQQKKSINRAGKVIKDWRDQERIVELNQLINKIAEIKMQQLKFKETRNDIVKYIKLLEELPTKVVKELTKISQI